MSSALSIWSFKSLRIPLGVGEVTEHCGPEYASSVKLGTLLRSQVSLRKQREEDISRSRMSEKGKVLCKMKMKMV